MNYSTKPLSVKSNMLWNSTGSLIYYLCQWLMTVLVVRLSNGFDAAGVLALVMSIYNIFQPFAVYRMYTYQVSDVNKENSTGEYLAFKTLTCFFAFSVCAVYTALTCSMETVYAVVLYCIYKGISLLVGVFQGHEQLSGRMDYIGKSLALQGIFALSAFSIVLYLLQDINLAIASMILTNLLIAILYDVPHYLSFEKFSFGIPRKKFKYLLITCFPSVISSVAFAASLSISKQFLSMQFGDVSLGIYASIAAPAAIIQMGATYIYNPVLNIFASYYVSNDRKQFMLLFLKVIVGIALIAIIATIVLSAIGPWLFAWMFGDSILPHLYLLIPVMILTGVSAFVWFLNDLLLSMRSFWGSFIGNVIAFLVAIPATLFCVPMWDMNGVSFAGIISCAVSMIVMLVIVARRVRRLSNSRD